MESPEIAPTQTRTSRSNAPSRRVAMRVIQNGQQMLAVYEMDPVHPGEPRSLVFEAPDSWIRVDEFPGDWHRMSDDELLSLRSGRE